MDTFEIKRGMLLWKKESTPTQSRVIVKDKDGNIIRTEAVMISTPRIEVRIGDIICDETTNWQPLVTYYEINTNPRQYGQATIDQFEWHSNDRICFTVKMH